MRYFTLEVVYDGQSSFYYAEIDQDFTEEDVVDDFRSRVDVFVTEEGD